MEKDDRTVEFSDELLYFHEFDDIRNLSMGLLRPSFEEPTARLMPGPVTSEEEEEFSSSERRRYKNYTVMQKAGFQHTEYAQIMVHLCRAEILISLIFLAHGTTCPGYPNEAEYQSTCHMNTVSAIVSLLTGAMGLGAVHRYRWRTMLILWLVFCIMSAVGSLLAVITTGIWLDHYSKMKVRTGLGNGLSGFMLLASVALGVCFILTAVMICHYWNSNTTGYQPVQKIAVSDFFWFQTINFVFQKRARSLRRRLSRAKSCDKKEARPPTSNPEDKGYHIV
ncbi:hypothetical protein CRE_10985 [Caenorhabditis remanei]|uniref:Uncharacterized protein n=1 Tax=Caenorhabditis remanei TaxID=31234 RepID=E3M5V5_CAERE|nr:hypothetical protein CRE_10985 [Caenorhabditis remanei]